MSGSRYQTLIESSSIQGSNAIYVEDLYEQYLSDPDSVDPEWRAYFRGVAGPGAQDRPHGPVRERFERLARQPRAVTVVADGGFDARVAEKQAAVLRLINYHRVRGHQVAKLDPLGLSPVPTIPDLDPTFHGLGPEDMDTVFNTGTLASADRLPLREILKILKAVYTDTIGAEYMYITETAQKRWIQKRLEGAVFKPKLSAEEKREVLTQLVAAEGIERYLRMNSSSAWPIVVASTCWSMCSASHRRICSPNSKASIPPKA
jgi:2-oxoglutarate dehydrogenase E1 component